MNQQTAVTEKIRIIPPDMSMRKKLGNLDLDLILSPIVVEEAQKIIVQSSNSFFEESVEDLKKLEHTLSILNKTPDKSTEVIPEIIAVSFAIKSKAGLGGYDLVSTIAKSLHSLCELLGDKSVPPANVSIIKWHVESIKHLLSLKVKGAGGKIGESILAELESIPTIWQRSLAPT